ncbi:RNA-guided endonuclease InsQ/TnpB family protein [Catenulispora sp. MAP12-49]|uniref:RNA-guided endonuclease InsQ/TnpB family protein n=1 Tax=Catenulispora sp. MAP12-49 TaxID=3156302 RepID=UPI003512A85A
MSDGAKIAAPRFLRQAERKLKRLHRELSRKQKSSANREKARSKLARQYARVADRRRDWHHQESTRIIRENRAGRDFAKVDRFAPTTMTCSCCGTRVKHMPLRIREWDCPSCGMRHDRDVNAARNILALGRRERLNACGGGVSPECVPAVVDEAGTDRSEGIWT